MVGATPSSKPRDKAEDVEAAIRAKIAKMPDSYRPIGERLHSLILSSAPELQPTTWYGMPAYAKNGKVICFFRADKYVTFGLTDSANHDLGANATDRLRNASWFLDELDAATEARITAIIRKAAS